jgi:hypothetical protein
VKTVAAMDFMTLDLKKDSIAVSNRVKPKPEK